MVLLLFISLVWLKIAAGTIVLLFWLWLVRDRAWSGGMAAFGYSLAVLFWLAPWILFVARQSRLYAGRCGLRQGIHACGQLEYVWTSLGWARYGFLLDLALFAGLLLFVARAHVQRRAARDGRTGLGRPA